MWQTIIPSNWSALQDGLGAHFLQSESWALFQQALGHTVFFADNKEWSWLAILERGKMGKRLYCPYGPTAQTPHALQEALVNLASCAKIHRCAYFRIEPQGPFNEAMLQAEGLLPAHRSIQPHYTFVKDLTKDEDALIAEMSATDRNLHRTAAKKGITFRTSTDMADINLFLSMMHEVAERNRIMIHPDEYYRVMARTLLPLNAAKIYIADINHNPAAASIIFDSSTTRYYAHAASRSAARQLHPGTPLVSHMIIDAKHLGKQSFDFCGVSNPDQPDARWAGFTQFKQSFGGHVVDMHGTWEYSLNHLSYRTYRFLIEVANHIKPQPHS